MNIYETVKQVNANRLEKCALSMTFDDRKTETYTYGTMLTAVDRYADTLQAAGVQTGDRVALVGASSPEWAIAFYAICKLRCTAALIDASMAAPEIDEFVRRSDVRAAFFSKKVAQKFTIAPDYGFPVFDLYSGKPAAGYRETVDESLIPTQDGNPDIACIIYSSGTTRKAAGIMHSHESLIKTTQMTIGVQHLTENDRFLSVIPNSHIYGLICLVLGPALVGGDTHYIESIAAQPILDAFKDYRPTVLSSVPKMYELFMTQILRKINANPVTRLLFKTCFPICLKKRQKNGSMLGKKLFKSIHEGFGGELAFVCSAGSPLSKEVAEFYYGTGFNLLLTYGASETNIPTIGNRPEDIHTDSCGVPYPDVQIRFADTGELLIHSPYMMKGYFRDPEQTAEMFTEDGWFKTGDLGHQDAQGYVHITGRCKENIVLASGKKMTPDDVEEKYAEIPQVKELVICGVPCLGEHYDEIHAFIVPQDDTKACTDSILEAVRARSAALADYMRVAHIHFVPSIPRTSLQKPKRYLLKQQAMTENEAELSAPQKPEAAPSDDMLGTVMRVVAEVANTEVETLTPQVQIFNELSIDSLSAINLALRLEDLYQMNLEPYYHDQMTIQELVDVLQHKGGKKTVIGQENVDYPQDKNTKDYLCYAFFRNLAKAVYKIRMHDLDKVPEQEGVILCANHVSKIDFLFITSAFSKAHFKTTCCMAKKELFRNDPFSRQLIKSSGMVPVDRSGINMKTMNNLCARLQENWRVVIHPEGTRSYDGVFRGMKSGACVLAIDAGVPIVPVYVRGMLEVFPRTRKMMRFFDWKHCKKFPIDIRFGDPIPSDGKTVEALTKEVEAAILVLQEQAIKNE